MRRYLRKLLMCRWKPVRWNRVCIQNKWRNEFQEAALGRQVKYCIIFRSELKISNGLDTFQTPYANGNRGSIFPLVCGYITLPYAEIPFAGTTEATSCCGKSILCRSAGSLLVPKKKRFWILQKSSTRIWTNTWTPIALKWSLFKQHYSHPTNTSSVIANSFQPHRKGNQWIE